jgi:hypothetical protein
VTIAVQFRRVTRVTGPHLGPPIERFVAIHEFWPISAHRFEIEDGCNHGRSPDPWSTLEDLIRQRAAARDPHLCTRLRDVQLLVDEARIGCTSGMLLCLDREQRLVYSGR